VKSWPVNTHRTSLDSAFSAGLAIALAEARSLLKIQRTANRIDTFPLAEHDIPDRLVIPAKLYGRAGEIATLLGAFERVVTSGTPELVLVSGYGKLSAR
jgi:hypothetical protein